MDPPKDRLFLLPKRCHSPAEDTQYEDTIKKKKRKLANPLLILVQDEVFGKREDGREACLADLEKQYKDMVANNRKQTNSGHINAKAVQADLIDLTDSLSLESVASTSYPRHNSPNTSYSSNSASISSSSSSSSFSSSYTSYSRPVAGGRLSDSKVPNSSILDCGQEAELELGNIGGRRWSKISSLGVKKDSFDDTSKDVSDIEDWDTEEEASVDIVKIT
eukprot:TRINITY_DN46975_c0_g1_i1.p1 TRINITY_DN46975_c0_g1~~TRINITY_DN46975_c0_g1_i1.p1  ORF type:complete len:220 (-),score=60.45 TRINITY_DN46975_c0_g1_i1:209-868(-)